ncbi:uncharacterized protein JCM6883_006831 [Sporobolomyces salmoneus]|uniref:uncharacterized protein n=1 Tax=Sporobolomyces salmoneus TaxID=183962 RepID=UPI00316ED4EC
MFSNYPLDRIALYSALFGTGIGLLLSLFGLVTTMSHDSVNFFPFFCILSGLWGILAFIEAAIYIPFRNEDPESANIFETGKKTLLLHAVWFGGGMICSIVLYSIWNSQDLFEKSGESYGLANWILVGEILLAVLPQLAAFGLYFYHPNPSSADKRKKKRKHKKKNKSKEAQSDEEQVYDDDDAKHEAGSESDLDGHGAGSTGGLSDQDMDLEKQPLKEGGDQDEYGDDYTAGGGSGQSKGQAGDEYKDDAYGDAGDGKSSAQRDDYASEYEEEDRSRQDRSEYYDSDRSADDRSRRKNNSSSHAHHPGTIHVESHRRDPYTGRDIVTEQDWNPDQNRYENYSTASRQPVPDPRSQQPPAPVYSYDSRAGSWTPVQPMAQAPQYAYPTQTTPCYPPPPPQQPMYAPRYSPVSPTYSSPPGSPIASPVSPTYAYPAQAQSYPYSYGQSPYYRR